MSPSPHDLDLGGFAPLEPLQVYYLLLGLERGARPLASFVNARCPESRPLGDAEAAAHEASAASAFTSHLHKYSLLAQVFPDPWLTFMNYGYRPDESPPPPWLVGGELAWPHAARMYHRVVRGLPVRGADVLEVGCGRGGGAAYVARHLAPRTVTATDACRSNVDLARRVHASPGLRFEVAHAETLPMADASCDVLINVESCKYYRPFRAFATGARRVLRPGGWLALAVHGPLAVVERIAETLAADGFTLVDREDVTPAVAAAIAHTRAGLGGLLAQHPCAHPVRHYRAMLEEVYAFDVARGGTWRYEVFAFRRAQPAMMRSS